MRWEYVRGPSPVVSGPSNEGGPRTLFPEPPSSTFSFDEVLDLPGPPPGWEVFPGPEGAWHWDPISGFWRRLLQPLPAREPRISPEREEILSRATATLMVMLDRLMEEG